MGNLRTSRRSLKNKNVWIAQETEKQRIQLARKVIAERAAKNADFAAELIKVVGDNLPKEIKEVCEESVREHAKKVLEDDAIKPIVGGDLTHTLVPVQTDGGGEILVNPDQLPDSPKDGN